MSDAYFTLLRLQTDRQEVSPLNNDSFCPSDSRMCQSVHCIEVFKYEVREHHFLLINP